MSPRVRADGFTLVEALMVIAIGIILLAMATVNIDRAVEASRGDGALYATMTQLRTARDMAISRRRSVQVEFIKPNRIRLTRFELPEGTTVINEVFLEGNVQFVQFAGLPDTPDGFGNADAVDFGGEIPLFIADGMSVDAAGTPLSGTVFLGIPDEPGSARAVTVFGGTGHVNGYRWSGVEWLQE